jgi:hypothetical protein
MGAMKRVWIRNGLRVVFPIVAVMAAAGVMGGCGSTQLVNLWQDPSYTVTPMRKIMVMAMRKEPLSRRMWEDAFVDAAAEKVAGAEMVASYHLFPNEMPEPSAMDTLMAKEGFDGVLIVAKIDRDTLTSTMPGYVTREPVTEYNPRWNTYTTRYETVYHPDYVDTTTAVSVRTDLLLAQKQGQLVWSVTSQTVDPSSRDEVRMAVAETAVKQLKKGGFIQ